MNFLIIVDSGDKENINKVQSQMEKGDVLITEKIGIYPSRMIHRALVYNKSKTDTKVILIKSKSFICEGLLYYLRTIDPLYGPLIIDDSNKFNMSTYYFTIATDVKFQKNDIVFFNKSLYTGRLADMSGHLDYNKIVETIIGPDKNRLLVGTDKPKNTEIVKIPIISNITINTYPNLPTFYYNMPCGFNDYFMSNDIPIPEPIDNEVTEEEIRINNKLWNQYVPPDINNKYISFDLEFEKICISFDDKAVIV